MQFLYYRPNHNRAVKREDVARWGLGYVFDGDDQPPSWAPCNGKTPDGREGKVFCRNNGAGEVPSINMDSQTWRMLPGDREGASVWIGVWNGHKPAPAELARPNTLAGYTCKLLDGHTWVVPLVRQYEEGQYDCALPRLLDFDDDGNPTPGQVIKQYRHLWELTAPIVDDLLATYGLGPEPDPPLTQAQKTNVAVELLQTNYRVSLPELVLLEAIPDDSTISSLCALACDWPELDLRMKADSTNDKDAKKNDSADDGPSTSSGEAA